MSFAPFQPGNASNVVCAPPATKSTAPSRRALTASSEGNNSTWASIPSSRYSPSSSAASAGKYEFVTRSGVAIFTGFLLQRSRGLCLDEAGNLDPPEPLGIVSDLDLAALRILQAERMIDEL